MAQREINMAGLHDRVVREIRNVLNQRDYEIHINPGQEKNAGIGDNYPDVVMAIKGTRQVKFILEVETSDSVTKEEAEGQWRKYANEIRATFYIVVPESVAFKAKQLCQQAGVNARFATYDVAPTGKISFRFK